MDFSLQKKSLLRLKNFHVALDDLILNYWNQHFMLNVSLQLEKPGIIRRQLYNSIVKSENFGKVSKIFKILGITSQQRIGNNISFINILCIPLILLKHFLKEVMEGGFLYHNVNRRCQWIIKGRSPSQQPRAGMYSTIIILSIQSVRWAIGY